MKRNLTYLIAGLLLITIFIGCWWVVSSAFNQIEKEGGIGGIIGKEVKNYEKAKHE